MKKVIFLFLAAIMMASCHDAKFVDVGMVEDYKSKDWMAPLDEYSTLDGTDYSNIKVKSLDDSSSYICAIFLDVPVLKDTAYVYLWGDEYVCSHQFMPEDKVSKEAFMQEYSLWIYVGIYIGLPSFIVALDYMLHAIVGRTKKSKSKK